jgi:16S rRNA (cytosine967-C5)-methyltransferase
VLAADLRPGRARRVLEASERLGLGSVLTVVADGRAPPLRPGGFDRVLLDAPCSGLGVLRRRPESRWRLQPADIDRAADLQRQLFATAALALRPGGLLAYSVCTLTRAETAVIDQWAAAEFPHLVAEAPPGPPWRPLGRGALLLPQAAGTDGMYLLLLRDTRS